MEKPTSISDNLHITGVNVKFAYGQMITMNFHVATFLCLLTVFFRVHSFNFDLDSQTIKYLLSEDQQQLKQERPSASEKLPPLDNSETGPILSEFPSSFFGYDFYLKKSSKNRFT